MIAKPPPQYDPDWMARLVEAVERADSMNVKKDGTLEIGGRGTRAEITDDVTGDRYLVGVSAGAISLTAL